MSNADLDPPCRAPQHPVSHLLQSIPPRSQSRSSRSNILSYTLHLATTARLSAYSSSNGTASLLHSAESHDRDAKVDEDQVEQEQKAAGLYKLSVNLLHAKRRGGDLPPSVERRVGLAGLTEDALLTPAHNLAVKRVNQANLQNSAEVDALKALAPLTSPDTTILYSAVAPAARATTSIAQSLIDMKFGNSVDGEAGQFSDNVKGEPVNGPRQDETVFGSSAGHGNAGAGPSRTQLTTAPHMDYRIVRGQAMRSRAKDIFAESILPTSETMWCRRHRVNDCSVCSDAALSVEEQKQAAGRFSRRNIAGQGFESGNGTGAKKALAELVPTFIVFSASLLRDLREKASPSSEEDKARYGLVGINVTAAWYNLLHSLAIQACLEGYLVDGWTGTAGIEVLFGCGCGVWEGRGWSRGAGYAAESRSGKGKSVADDEMDVDSDEEEESDEEEATRVREGKNAVLVEAAQTLFGARDAAQADFERSMRDRIHEVRSVFLSFTEPVLTILHTQFLNVPEETTLYTHLVRLNAKYPLSSFESQFVDFLESTSRLLGKPALAKVRSLLPFVLFHADPSPSTVRDRRCSLRPAPSGRTRSPRARTLLFHLRLSRARIPTSPPGLGGRRTRRWVQAAEDGLAR